jgi:hypothetical protein
MEKSERPYTDAQRCVREMYASEVETMFVWLLDAAKACRDAIVELPYANERGERVDWGCNEEVRHLGVVYYDAAVRFSTLLDLERAYKLAEERNFLLNHEFHKRASTRGMRATAISA